MLAHELAQSFSVFLGGDVTRARISGSHSAGAAVADYLPAGAAVADYQKLDNDGRDPKDLHWLTSPTARIEHQKLSAALANPTVRP